MPELPPFRDESNPVWERRVNELEKGEGIGEITAAKIGTGAVTEAKIGAKAVTGGKIAVEGVKFENTEKAAAVPAKPAEGTISTPTRSLIRKAVIRWQVKATEKEVKKVKHELASTQLVVSVIKMAAELGATPLTNTKGATETEFTYVIENAEEIEIKLGKEEAAKTEYLIVVCA